MGIPFIDGNRLWSIIDHTIKSSDDFGVTWTDWLTIDPIESPIPTLFRDRQGNKYYAAYRERDIAPEHGKGCLMRVDHETKVVSRVLDFLVNGPGLPTGPFSKDGVHEPLGHYRGARRLFVRRSIRQRLLRCQS